jgi:hypothetical protein
MRYADLHGIGWQQMGYALIDLTRYFLWWCMGGLVACGSGWCAGQLMYTEWVRDTPAPRIRLFAELRLRREVARGLVTMEDFLAVERPELLEPRTELDEPLPPQRTRGRGWPFLPGPSRHSSRPEE